MKRTCRMRVYACNLAVCGVAVIGGVGNAFAQQTVSRSLSCDCE